MPSFDDAIADAKPLSEEQQKKAGQALAGDIDEEHKNFLKTLIGLIESGGIDPEDKESFLNRDTYDALDETWRDKTDLALMNIADQIKLIHEFRTSNDTPEESPHLQTMVEQLWQMKQKIEEHHDVFKF